MLCPRLTGADSEADARPLRVCNYRPNLCKQQSRTAAFDRAVLTSPDPLPHVPTRKDEGISGGAAITPKTR
jgi:hypothetical protein